MEADKTKGEVEPGNDDDDAAAAAAAAAALYMAAGEDSDDNNDGDTPVDVAAAVPNANLTTAYASGKGTAVEALTPTPTAASQTRTEVVPDSPTATGSRPSESPHREKLHVSASGSPRSKTLRRPGKPVSSFSLNLKEMKEKSESRAAAKEKTSTTLAKRKVLKQAQETALLERQCMIEAGAEMLEELDRALPNKRAEREAMEAAAAAMEAEAAKALDDAARESQIKSETDIQERIHAAVKAAVEAARAEEETKWKAIVEFETRAAAEAATEAAAALAKAQNEAKVASESTSIPLLLSLDDYFMGIAVLTSHQSSIAAKQHGVCVVNPQHRIIGHGYNTFSPGMVVEESDQFESTFEVSAEIGAIFGNGNMSFIGARIYVTDFPTAESAKLIVQSGIRELVYLHKFTTSASVSAGQRILEGAQVSCRELCPEHRKVVISLG